MTIVSCLIYSIHRKQSSCENKPVQEKPASDSEVGLINNCLLFLYAGSHVSSKPSAEFLNLLEGLLTKHASRRMSWSELIVHQFWQGALQHLLQEMETSTDARESLRRSVANFTVTVDDRPATAVGWNTSVNNNTDAAAGFTADDARPGKFNLKFF